MVCEDSSFIGTPNNGFLKPPPEDDEIDFFTSEVELDGVADDSLYFITDEEEIEEIYDDNSYVDDTYDEDDYYFSEDDDVDEEFNDDDGDDVYISDTDSSSESTLELPAAGRLFTDTSDSSGASHNSNDKISTNPTQTNTNGATNNG